MTIEATLLSIDATLKALLASAQSGAQMAAAEFAASDTGTTRKRRTKAEIIADEAAEAAAKLAAAAALTQAEAPVVDGHPAGTRYWVNAVDRQVYAELPGTPAPEGMNFKIESAAEYLAKKVEFDKAGAAKNEQAAATAPVTANTAPSATAPAATASAAASGSAEATWDAAVTALKTLAQNPDHGSAAVMAVIKQIDPAAANVPALKPLGKNAEIVAAVNALLNPAAAAAEVDPLFG